MSVESETPRVARPVPTYAWVWLGLSLLAGPVGLIVFGFVCLLRAKPPTSVAGRRLRTVGLAAGWAATAAAAVGGVVGLVLGLDYPPTLAFAVVEGTLIGALPALVLGALAGLVLVAFDVLRGRHA